MAEGGGCEAEAGGGGFHAAAAEAECVFDGSAFEVGKGDDLVGKRRDGGGGEKGAIGRCSGGDRGGGDKGRRNGRLVVRLGDRGNGVDRAEVHRRAEVGGEHGFEQGRTGAERDDGLEEKLELAHVAGKRVRPQAPERGGVDLVKNLVVPLGKLGQQRPREQLDVSGAVAEWRERDGDLGEAVVQVGAEGAFGDARPGEGEHADRRLGGKPPEQEQLLVGCEKLGVAEEVGGGGECFRWRPRERLVGKVGGEEGFSRARFAGDQEVGGRGDEGGEQRSECGDRWAGSEDGVWLGVHGAGIEGYFSDSEIEPSKSGPAPSARSWTQALW